jgi:SAM-dependent methyltransferase
LTTEALTNDAYWDASWTHRAVPAPLDPHAPGLNGTVPRAYHAFFAEMFTVAGIQPGDSIMEVGCGGSQFLPYLARAWKLEARGIDYSTEGCKLAEAIARNAGIAVTVEMADVFGKVTKQSRFVYSCGLVEHFRPTETIIGALHEWCDGYLLTMVPNMNGLPGWLQRLVQPEIFAAHVPLTPAELAEAHEVCGLEVLRVGYFMAANFSVVNPTGNRFGGSVLRGMSWMSKAIWILQRLGLPVPENRLTSPHVYVLARARGSEKRHGDAARQRPNAAASPGRV